MAATKTTGADFIKTYNDFKEYTTELIPEQFNGTDVEKLLFINDPQLQEIQNTAMDLLRKYWLDTAEGTQLDVLGKYVFVERLDKTDDLYRRAISAQIGINVSTGTREAIINAIKALYNASQVTLTYIYPAKIGISENGDNIAFTQDFKNTIEQIAPAGVGLLYQQQLLTASATVVPSGAGDNLVTASSTVVPFGAGDNLVTAEK